MSALPRPVLERPKKTEPLRPFIYSVRLSEDEIARLNRFIRSSERTASDVFRDALTEYLERYE
jgi:hypothetical protein